MKTTSTLWGWNGASEDASFLPQSKMFIKKAFATFAFFSLVAFFSALSIDAATFIVTTNADNESDGCYIGNCTFREAISDANALPGNDMITFQVGVSGKINLTRGHLLITDDTSLENLLSEDVTIVGNAKNKIFFASADDLVTNVKNFTITGRNSDKSSRSNSFAKASPEVSYIQIKGIVSELTGHGIARAFVVVTDGNGNRYMSMSNGFGFYRLAGIPAGQTCILSATHFRYSFGSQVINSIDDYWAYVYADNDQRLAK